MQSPSFPMVCLGCINLIRGVDFLPLQDFADESLQQLTAALQEKGYTPYVTTIGGSGLGVLWPRDGEEVPTAATPGGTQPFMRTGFENVPTDRLGSWAASHGRWLFV